MPTLAIVAAEWSSTTAWQRSERRATTSAPLDSRLALAEHYGAFAVVIAIIALMVFK